MTGPEQVSIKEHFNQRFVDSEKAINIALTASQRASDLALEAQKVVNATQNEFRGALKDAQSAMKEAQSVYITQGEQESFRREMMAQLEKLESGLRSLELTRGSAVGRKEGVGVGWGVVVAVSTLMGVIVALILTVMQVFGVRQ